jgi:hypothetical protein
VVREAHNHLSAIWTAHCIVVANGGGSAKRHLEPAICAAKKYLKQTEDALSARSNELRDRDQEAS